MSRIFDALQRFDQEKRAGEAVNPPAPGTSVTDGAAVAAAAVPAILAEAKAQPDWTPKPLRISPEASNHVVAIDEPYSVGAENFRVLSSRLTQMKTAGKNRLLVTSTVTDEGKTLIATNLAATLAKKPGQRVLLIEGDLRKPQVLTTLGAHAMPGIGEWYKSGGSIFDYIYRIQSAEFFVLPTGTDVGDPVQVLESEVFGRTMTMLAHNFDWIIIDSSPLLPVADTSCWMSSVDSAVIVVREGKTPKNLVTKALKGIDQSKVIGTVLNDVSRSKTSYSKYYGYQYGSKPEVKR